MSQNQLAFVNSQGIKQVETVVRPSNSGLLSFTCSVCLLCILKTEVVTYLRRLLTHVPPCVFTVAQTVAVDTSQRAVEVKEEEDVTSTATPPAKSHSKKHKLKDSKSHSHSKSHAGKAADSAGVKEGVSALHKDTTSQHGTHTFDQYCSICTGKAASPLTQVSSTEE